MTAQDPTFATAETQRPARRRSFVPLAAAASLAVSGVVVGATFSSHGAVEEGFQMAARYTARLAFVLFLLPFAATPLFTLWRNGATRTLVRHRRALGVAYGLAQMVHLGAVVAFFLGTHHELEPGVSSLGGGFGFLMAGLMTATSNDASVRRLGRRWKTLHVTGAWTLWFIYTFTYVGRMDVSYWPGMLACVALVGLRLAAARRRAG